MLRSADSVVFHDFYFICPSHLLLDENNVCVMAYAQKDMGSVF